jgi:putative transposase
MKSDSSTWINKRRLSKFHFSWQEGFGGFSYCKAEVPKLINYVRRQQEHHRKKTFLEEYTALLKEFEIDYDPAYVFKPPA